MPNEPFQQFVERIDEIARQLGVMATIGPA
jgi:hypothetical protein